MKTVRNIFHIAVVCLFLSSSGFAEGKEPLPVSGSFSPARTTAAAGDLIEFSLEFSSSVKVQSWELEIEMPEGMLLLEGERVNRGLALEVQRKYVFSYKFKLLNGGEKKLWARLHYTGDMSDGITLSAAFLAVVNEAPKRENSELKTDRKGRKIRVLKVPTSR